MDGFGSHTFQWVDAEGSPVWVKYHFKTDQGVKCLDSSEAAELAGLNPDQPPTRPGRAIDRDDLPSWTLSVQVMTPEQAADARVKPVRPHQGLSQKGVPRTRWGRLTLDRTPRTISGRGTAGFDPAISSRASGPPRTRSPGPAVRLRRRPSYRLGINHTQLRECAHAAEVHTTAVTGSWPVTATRRQKNYEPNSFDGPVETGEPFAAPLEVSGVSGTTEWNTGRPTTSPRR